MADSRKRPASPGTPECSRAREALAEGDYRLARQLAREVLADPAASEAAKAEAAVIARSTHVDRAAVVTGLIILVVLILLFWFVFRQGHP